MWTRKLDHAIFLREEGYVWADRRNKLIWKFVVIGGLALMAGVIVSTVV
ncbi:MAG: hypothetical protein OXH27_01995 [Gammaproteobacteria bacterium]|nr:hypothetical protein [Gammaproteobacteria bacterium]MCY3687684.1 hypothetical protein [Gammaproteobacteria bacterium]MDE0479178.1 hypothetical protein [Gammaproteobacteria bacterium]MDE0507806.1 hypothetical protein [Gammaproteobacteria bacterium]